MNQPDYTLGKEPEAVILWSLIKDDRPLAKRVITSKVHKFTTELNEIRDSNLSESTKKRLLTAQWHRYKENYVNNHGYDATNKVDTFYLCLLKIRYRTAIGYKKIKKETDEN